MWCFSAILISFIPDRSFVIFNFLSFSAAITTTTFVPNSTITPCPVGYTGSFCQTPLCNGVVNGCANGGTCSGKSNIEILFKKH